MATKDVLSNEEVDAIMETVADQPDTSGVDDGDENVHRVFDFASKERAAQNQLLGLSVANERLNQEFQLSLEKTFGMRVEVVMHSPEVLKLEECITELKHEVIFNLVELNISRNRSLLALDEELLSGFINRYFGSQLVQANTGRAGKKLNTTESRINDRVVNLFGAALTNSWREIANVELHRVATEINSDFVRLGRGDDMVVRFVMDTSFGDFSGAITWLVYYDAIEPLLSRREKQDAGAGALAAEEWRGRLYDYIQDVNLNVHVRLPDFAMTLGQVHALDVGTVLPLGNPAEACLYIEEAPMFWGEYGAYEGNKALSLTQRIETTG